MLQQVASLPHSARINRLGTLFDVLNDPLLVHQEGGANGEAFCRIQHPVLLADGPFEVAQQREANAEVLGKAMVAGGSIYADAKYLNVVCIVMCDISLIRP